ncbi:hypothetical protein [Massilia sp. S19_KUP03_FR1]|uniref:hypothetical protein n=1 Tax=Massilia sp. S19_KUP03_FR1 TaxID=3025503 RepID=UPI002FCDC65B
MTSLTAPHILPRPAAPCGRPAWAAWLARLLAIVLLVQLFALTQHDHPVSSKSQHCAACALHAQPHAGPPQALPAPAPFSWTLLHAALQVPPLAAPARAAAWLLPPAHAPPAFLPLA